MVKKYQEKPNCMKIIGKPRSKCRNTALSKRTSIVFFTRPKAGRGSRSDKAQNMGWQVEC